MAAEQTPDRTVDGILPAGTQAPDFTLKATPEKSYSLADFKGRPVVLAFYPADWSPVCGDQMALYNEMLDEFAGYNAEMLGISVDGEWCHKAFAEARRIHFPLLADFEPKGEISRRYGVYDRQSGTSRRALFVIDGNGVVRWSYLSPINVNPGADGILTALDKIAADRSSAQVEQPRTAAPRPEQRNEGEISAR